MLPLGRTAERKVIPRVKCTALCTITFFSFFFLSRDNVKSWERAWKRSRRSNVTDAFTFHSSTDARLLPPTQLRSSAVLLRIIATNRKRFRPGSSLDYYGTPGAHPTRVNNVTVGNCSLSEMVPVLSEMKRTKNSLPSFTRPMRKEM